MIDLKWYFLFLPHQSAALGARTGSAMAIIGAEDEDFENDIEPVSGKYQEPVMSGRGNVEKVAANWE